MSYEKAFNLVRLLEAMVDAKREYKQAPEVGSAQKLDSLRQELVMQFQGLGR